MTNDKLRVAVVGSGIGRSHVAAYCALPDMFEVAAICDVDLNRGQALAQAFGVPQVTGSLDDLRGIAGLDVIDICTPPLLHVGQVQKALEAGVHVVCEKPLAGSLADLDRLAEAEALSGRRVMPIFNYRFGHGVQKLRHLIAAGLAGQPYLGTLEVAWRRRASYYAVPWRGRWETELGGCLTGHAIHFLDLLLYVLGPARSVYARTATMVNPIEVEDTASLSLEMANGCLASVSVTLGSSVEISRQRYCFANVVAESNLEPYAKNCAEPWTFGADSPELQVQIDAELAAVPAGPEGFEGQFARFHEALRSGGELPVTLADARRTLELLTACYASAEAHAPVALPIAAGDPLYHGWLTAPSPSRKP